MNVIIFVILICSLFSSFEAVSEQELWFEFKETYGKFYETLDEEKFRFDIFFENYIKIEKHNQRYKQGAETYYLGLNKFADLTSEEFMDILNSQGFSRVKNFNDGYSVNPEENDIPDAVDWREKGIVTDAETSQCAASWAVSTTGSLEGQLALKTSKLIPLSEQQLIDCSSKFGNNGCNGGNMEMAFQYVDENGLASAKDYPLSDGPEECYDDSVEPAVEIESYSFVESNEEDLKIAVATIGPLSAAVEATSSWQFYSGGIMSGICPGDTLNHAILIVGYNSTTSLKKGYDVVDDYWILRNDWGKNWGEDGYIKIARNRNNQCGIADYVLYPTLL